MLTASVVLFNTPRHQIDSLFNSVLNAGCVKTFYIIDNSPSDRWRILEREFAGKGTEIRYIHNENLGYGASHNLAMSEAVDAGTDYHVVLNPDIYCEGDVLPALVRFMDSELDAAYVLPRVEYPDGELLFLCKLLPTPADLIFRRFLPQSWGKKRDDRDCLKISGYDKVMNPPCLSGCFMFMRLSVLKEHGIFFDDGYFMYCEDFDLIRRLHRVAKTLYYPDVRIIHDHQKESYKSRAMLWAHIKSALRYFNKYGWVLDKERSEMNKQILTEIGLV